MMVPFVGDTIRAVTHVDVHADQLRFVLDSVSEVLAEGGGQQQNGSSIKSPYGDW